MDEPFNVPVMQLKVEYVLLIIVNLRTVNSNRFASIFVMEHRHTANNRPKFRQPNAYINLIPFPAN